MAATRAGAHVHACDIDPFARVVTRLNAEANGFAADAIPMTVEDLVGSELPGVDVLLAGDVWYEPEPSARFRRWFRKLARRIPVLTAGQQSARHKDTHHRPQAGIHIRRAAQARCVRSANGPEN